MMPRLLSTRLVALVAWTGLTCGCAAGTSDATFEPFEMSLTPDGNTYPDVDSVILLDRGALRFTVDPKTSDPIAIIGRYVRRKYLRIDGPSQHPLRIVVEPGTVVVNVRAQVTHPGAEPVRVASSRRVRREGDKGFDEWVISMADVRPGTVVEYTYDTYFRDLRFLPPWSFQSGEPILSSEFAVIVPSPFEVDLRVAEDGAFIDWPPDRFQTDKNIRFFWSRSDVPALFPEPDMPDAGLLARRAYVDFLSVNVAGQHYQGFLTWDDVGAWLRGVNPNWNRLSSETQSEALRLTKNLPLTEQALKLQALVADSIGDEALGYPPTWRAPIPSPTETLRTRRGNPTSRGMLLVSLLRGIGIPAAPGLVADRRSGFLSPDRPNVREVDRVVAVVPLVSGDLILDPSEHTVDLNVPVPCAQGGWLVTLHEDGAVGSRVPVSLAQHSRTELDYELVLAPRGGLSGNFRGRLTGAEAGALRAQLLRATPAQYAEVVTAFLALRGGAGTIESVSVTDLRELRRPLQVAGTLESARLFEGGHESESVKVGSFVGEQGRELRSSRRTPLILAAPHEIEIRTTLTLPEDFRVDEVPASAQFSWEGGTTELLIRKETTSRIGFIRNVRQSSIEVPVDGYVAYRRYHSELRASEQQPMIIHVPPPEKTEY
jgi:transglutaminase-like putative cysteine protease